MIVQHLVLPTYICEKKELYFRTNEKVEIKKDGIYIEPCGTFSTDTYFNLFDAFTWKKYTGVSDFVFEVACAGKGRVALYFFDIYTESEKKIEEKLFESLEEKIINFNLNNPYPGYYYLIIDAEEKSVISNILVQTMTEAKQDICLGVNICTFKREQQICDNIKMFMESRFFQVNSGLYGKLKICVVDNASELKSIDHPLISIIHNRNTGGTGGFTRGIKQFKSNSKNITHMVFMDDDVQFIPETFYRLYSLLSYLLPEYKESVVAGRMFRMDCKYIQYTAAEKWNCGDIQHIGFQCDMSRKENLKDINNPHDSEYTGWWLGCFPMDFVKENMPIPFFIHCDDVEYGLRHGGTPIILNGIQVWHETFEYRQNPVIAYYDMRNSLFVNSIYENNQSKKNIIDKWKEKITIEHNKKDYLSEYMIILALIDFCKGIKWLYEIDAERYHRKLQKSKSYRIYNSLLWRLAKRKYERQDQRKK